MKEFPAAPFVSACNPVSSLLFPFVPNFSLFNSESIFLSVYISLFNFGPYLLTHDVRVWQFSLLRLAVGGNLGSFTDSHFLCWLSIDYLWQQTVTLCASLSIALSLHFSFSHFLYLISLRHPSHSTVFLPLSPKGAAPAVWEQIALLLLGLGEWTRPQSYFWERGRANVACATTMCYLFHSGRTGAAYHFVKIFKLVLLSSRLKSASYYVFSVSIMFNNYFR